jgi:glycosyltransferase involved in cell wall biosynthesis
MTYGLVLALIGRETPLVLSGRDYSNICALRTLLRDGRACDGPAVRKCLSCARQEYGPVGAVVGVSAVLGQRRLLARRINALQSCSGFMQQTLHKHLLGSRDLSRLAADVVIPDYRTTGTSTTESCDSLPDEPYILFVGALRKIKGIHVLFAAYERLDNPPPLVLIGTASNDSLPPLPRGAVLLGSRSHGQVMAAWKGALFGVAPSTLPEPLGNVIHEAMSIGRPVIGTVPSGQTEMISHDENGLLVPSGDALALEKAMRRLIDDPDLRERLGRAAPTAAARFTEDVQLPRFSRLLEDVSAPPKVIIVTSNGERT